MLQRRALTLYSTRAQVNVSLCVQHRWLATATPKQGDGKNNPNKHKRWQKKPTPNKNGIDKLSTQVKKQENSSSFSFERYKPQRKLTQDNAPTDKSNVEGEEGPTKEDLVKICGINACKALFERRRQDIIRVYILEERAKAFGTLLKHCAENKLAYHIVDTKELERVSATLHHQGVCILANTKPPLDTIQAIKQATTSFLPKTSAVAAISQPCSIILDNIRNPHNVGAILRVCAGFGVQTVFSVNVEEKDEEGGDVPPKATKLPTAVYRISEGAAEYVDVVPINDYNAVADTLEGLKKRGCKILATSSSVVSNTASGRSLSLYDKKITSMLLPTHPVAIILGNEQVGVSEALMEYCDDVVRIPGTGWIESLNVAQATAVLLGEVWRNHGGSLASKSADIQKAGSNSAAKWQAKINTKGSRTSAEGEADFEEDEQEDVDENEEAPKFRRRCIHLFAVVVSMFAVSFTHTR